MLRSEDLPQAPAFDSLRPGPPKAQPADYAATSALRLALGLRPTAQVSFLVANGSPISGKYVVEQDGRKIFVKQVPPEGYGNHLLADGIARHAASRGAAVAHLLGDSPKKAADGTAYFAYPYFEHRYCDDAEEDISALGEALARMHTALRDFPGIEDVKRLTRKRYDELDAVKAAIDGNTQRFDSLPTEVERCLRFHSFETVLLTDGNTQLIHGDLNYTNVCFPPGGGQPRFVDFETAPRSYLSTHCDLAQILDRFILTAPQNLWGNLLAAFCRGYTQEADLSMPPVDRLLPLIRSLAMRSLLLLCLRHETGASVAISEWKKFTDTFARVEVAGNSDLSAC